MRLVRQLRKAIPLCIVAGGNVDKVGSVVRFNNFVRKIIREEGTCKLAEQTNDRIACFEVASGGGGKGCVGWWEDDHSQMTYAATPYEVYCTMPHED